jgi:PAS domain S-box-containing protein
MQEEAILGRTVQESAEHQSTFHHFAAYAKFIRDNYLVPFVEEQIRLSKELKQPWTKFANNTGEDEMIVINMGKHVSFLNYAAENRLAEHRTHVALPGKHGNNPAEILVSDTYIRKKALLKFISVYTTDVNEAIGIVEEMETYFKADVAAETRLYVQHLKKNIEDDASEKLALAESRHRQIEEMARTGSWSWDMLTGKIEWSDILYNIYGIENGKDLNLEEILNFNDPEQKSRIKDRLKHTLKTQEPTETHYHITLKDGSKKILHAKSEVISDGNGKPKKMIGIIQDVTGEKLAEKKLNEYKEFIEKITNVTPSIIASYNIHTGKYTFINSAVEKLLGYPAAGIIEQGLQFMTSIVHPDDLPVIMEQSTSALEAANRMNAGEEEPIVEFLYRMKNTAGEYRWFRTYGTVFERDSSGMVESVLNISVDVTDNEQTEQALSRKNLELQQSNTSLEEYAFIVSHDLKEPLRKIATFSDRLMSTQAQALNADGRYTLGKITDAATRMQKMINDLLSVSTIFGNKAYEPCDLNMLLAEIIQTLDYKIEESKAVIEAGMLPTVAVVPSQFRQLFQNLIGNSLKFAKKGVAPHIRISARIPGRTEIGAYKLSKTGKYVCLEVADNGIGFSDKDAPKIFTIFQRLHGKAEYEGTGIGLAICKKVVENHNGLIFAKGELNKGATFTIILPAA